MQTTRSTCDLSHGALAILAFPLSKYMRPSPQSDGVVHPRCPGVAELKRERARVRGRVDRGPSTLPRRGRIEARAEAHAHEGRPNGARSRTGATKGTRLSS